MPRTWPLILFVVVVALIIGRSPAIAQAETISGTVTGPSNQALQGVCVVAWDPNDSNTTGIRGADPDGSDVNGAYAITNLAPGSYKILFTTGNNTNCGTNTTPVVAEYYDDQPTFAAGAAVPVNAGQNVSNINAQLAFPTNVGSISGQVTNLQTPTPAGLQSVCVAALDPDDALGATIVGSTMTDATGNYTIANLPQDSYKVIFITDPPCPGSATRIFTEYYNDRASFALGDLVHVTAGNTTTANASVDRKPVAGADTATVTEDTPTDIAVLANDTDPDNPDVIEIETVTDPPSGTATIKQGSPDQITYTPDANYCDAAPPGPPDSFSYTINGGDTATVAVTVTCVEDHPVAVDDATTIDEDTTATPAVLTNDQADADGGDDKEITSVGNAANGVTAPTGAGPGGNATGVSYVPNKDFCGTDTFTYVLEGGDSATVTVTVVCIDDATAAVADSATVSEDSPATTINVRANDTDPDTKATIASASNGSNGTVTVTNGADLTYAPAANFCGTDSFTYTLGAGAEAGKETATVTVTVTCAEDPAAPQPDSYAVPEDAPRNLSVLGNDSDVDSPLNITAISAAPAHGTATIVDGTSPEPDRIQYSPAANYCGPDSLKYTLNGGPEATVTIDVTCIDDAPVAVNDELTVAMNATPTGIDVVANDTDVDGGRKKPVTVTDPPNGAAALIGTENDSDARIIYVPDKDYCDSNNPDTFTYALNGNSSATVAVTVTCPPGREPGNPNNPQDPDVPPDEQLPPGDAPPTAVADELTVAEGSGPTRVDVLANDTDTDGGAIRVIATDPGQGTVAIVEDGAAITYDPAPGFCGTDSFTYTLIGDSTATVVAHVTCTDVAGAPETRITKAPKRTIRTKKKRVKVKFAFRSSEPLGATYRCKLDDGGFDLCKSPATYRLKPGRHTFRVYAVDSLGNPDKTPAKVRVRVVKKKPPKPKRKRK